MKISLVAALALVCFVLLCAAGARAEMPKSVAIDLARGGNLDLVLVPGGTFMQGSPATEKGRADDERRRQVTLRDFYMGKNPVTRGQFAAFVTATSYRTEAEKGVSGGFGWDGTALVQRKEFTWKNPGFAQTSDDPVTLVTYDDAMAFAGWASQRAGRKIVLPTEAQWEYAARAGTTTPYFSGSKEEDALAIGWFKKNAGNGTRPAGQKTPNAFGLYDMGGNVFEWCRDWYAPYPEGDATDPDEEARPMTDTPRRVLRGGSWLKDTSHGRSAARWRNSPGSRDADNGFRVATSDLTGGAQAPTRQPGAIPPGPPPLPIMTPTPTPPRGPSMAPLALLLGGGGVALVLFLLLRKRGGTGSPVLGSFTTGNVSVRVAADGFWLGAGLRQGTRVKYTCTVRGVPVTDTVTADGGPQGTFVYTGGAPENVRVLEVTSVDDDYPPGGTPLYRGVTPSPRYVAVPVQNDDPAPAPPFVGYPPAY